MFAAGAPVQERGFLSRPFVFGLILLLLFLTATTEIGPPPQRQNGSVTLKGNDAEPDDPLKDEILYKLSVANAQLEKENRIYRIHILELRRQLQDCKGANFTTDLQRAYRLADLRPIRTGVARQHHRRGDSASQQQQQQGGVTEQATSRAAAGQQQGDEQDAATDTPAGVNARLLSIGSPFERH